MRRSALALLLGCLLLVAGASALDGYDYYQTIEYAACDQEIYQQDIVIHRSEGEGYQEESSGLKIWHIYVGDHCREDYGDVRFTDSTGAELAYYLWPDYDAESARFTVRLEGADAAGELLVWYGNPSATTTSDGDATFELFDEFNGLWPTYSGSPYSGYPKIVDGEYAADSAISLRSVNHGNLVVKSPDLIDITNKTVVWRQKNTLYVSWDSNPYMAIRLYSATGSMVGSKTYTDPPHRPTTWTTETWTPTQTGDVHVAFWYWDDEWTTNIDWILVRTYSATPPAATTFSGEQSPAAPPVTAFTASPTAGLAPLTVQFTDLSTGGPTSWLWTFGDGGTSTTQNPQHTYTAPGLYTVTLNATNEYGSDEEIRTDYITVYAPVTAQFSANVTGGIAPLTVQFTDLSTGGPTAWSWSFGDGNTSAAQNPVHTYTTAGTHTVTLTASHPYDSDTETKTAYITIAVLQPFPGLPLIPRDLAGNGLYTDINGNNRLDYNDLTVFFQHLAWAKTAQPIACFDFNGNGWLDYNDVITLFSIIMEEHT
jgi:PKD repeat protein